MRAFALRFAVLGYVPSALYYAFVSRAFDREHYAVAVAVRRNLENHSEVARYRLRRNVHRLEKGLLMRPRRTPFGLDYIDETVDLFVGCVVDPNLTASGDLEWASDVLAEYFAAVGPEPRIADVRSRFEEWAATSVATPTRVPSERSEKASEIDYNQFLGLMQQRHSVRWFQQKPVPRQSIDRAVVAASHAPSGCNRQPYTYWVIDDPELVREVSGIPLGTGGFRDNIPAIVCLVGDLSAFFGERDRHGIYVDASLSAMAFMLALESQGLSSCPLNWPDVGRLERRARATLDLAPHERIVMFIAVGYPDPSGMVAHSQRRGIDEVRHYVSR
jgi:nitroreductase